MPICCARIRVCKPLPSGISADPATLAEHLRRRRVELGRSQEAAARTIGVAPVTLQKWESIGVLPDPDVLDAVEGYLGVCFVRWTRRIGVCLETVTKLERGRLDGATLDVRGRVFDALVARHERAPHPSPTPPSRAESARRPPLGRAGAGNRDAIDGVSGA